MLDHILPLPPAGAIAMHLFQGVEENEAGFPASGTSGTVAGIDTGRQAPPGHPYGGFGGSVLVLKTYR